MERCFGAGDPLYEHYHDTEWGRPIADTAEETVLFERLVLEGFQSGLSWITVLRKREAFREVFAGFDPARVAQFDEQDIGRLMGDARIIRNEAKIRAAVGNAKALVALHEAGGTLAGILADHAPGPPWQRPGAVTRSPAAHRRARPSAGG